MITKTIRSSWWEGYGYRLDCQPYLAGALETKILLERLSLRKEPLHTLTKGHGGGIFHAGRETRQWVESSTFGVPFMSGSSLLSADLSNLPLLSKRQIEANPLLSVHEGWILITRSGTIGKIAYARGEMDGLACSEDVIRVAPDESKIPSGYLYAFLSSKFGIPLIVSGTYGAIIQHIEPNHIADLPVPRFDRTFERDIHTLVHEAARLRTQASLQISEARQQVMDHLGLPRVDRKEGKYNSWAAHPALSSEIEKLGTLSPLFYNPLATSLDRWIERHPSGFAELGNIARIFDVPPFKHIYVEPDYGIGFFTSGDIFLIDKKPDKYLSKARTKGLEKYILEAGWVLLARSGSLGGNIARMQFVDSAMNGLAASDHVIRIAPKSPKFLPGYLYAYLSTPLIGYPLILRTATGACVPALWPSYLERTRVIQPSKSLNIEVDKQVKEAFEMRVRATALEDSSRSKVETALEQWGS